MRSHRGTFCLVLSAWLTHTLRRFLVVPMQAFFIAGVQGGSVTLFIGTLLHMFLPLWGHLVRDALCCTAFPAQSLPSLYVRATHTAHASGVVQARD